MRPRQQLAAEADTEHRHAEIIRLTQPLELGQQPVPDRRVVPGTPGRSHRHEDVEVTGIGEIEGLIGLTEVLGRHDNLLDDLETPMGQALGNWPRRADVIVLQDQGAHGGSFRQEGDTTPVFRLLSTRSLGA